MTLYFYWRDIAVPFLAGESVAFALYRASNDNKIFGKSSVGQTYGLFCGIGACQGCLVHIEGRGIVEACMIPASEELRVRPVTDFDRLDIGGKDSGHE